MKVVTAAQMRELDRLAIVDWGIPGIVLMENAGRAVAALAATVYAPLTGRQVLLFCGAGNNGGDGFVAARHLLLGGARPTLCRVGESESLSAEARVHFEIACRMGIPTVSWQEFTADLLPGPDGFLIDALLGTGVRSAPRDAYAAAIEIMNSSGVPVLAVDLPSGVDADTGGLPGSAVRAAHTVTFGYPKIGLLTFPGAACAGRLEVADIGFPWDNIPLPVSARLLTRAAFTDADQRRAVFGSRLSAAAAADIPPLPGVQPRPANANKGDFGHVAILAGSRGMAGAPALAARAAQRAGAGLVTVLAPVGIQPTIAAKLDEQMTVPLPEAEGALAEAAFDQIAAFVAKATVLCIGPGLTTAPETVRLIGRILSEIDCPVVLDADGLNALARMPEWPAESGPALRVLTPHPGEAARLMGTSVPDVESNRLGAVRILSDRFHATVLLKGRHTLVTRPDGLIGINTTGNPGMSTGGSGDVLTGMVGGLLAQAIAPRRNAPRGMDASEVSRAHAVTAQAVYLHGMAGDIAAGKSGQVSLSAGDLIHALPEAIRTLEGKT